MPPGSTLDDRAAVRDRELDAESAQWLRALGAAGVERDQAAVRLHQLLLRIEQIYDLGLQVRDLRGIRQASSAFLAQSQRAYGGRGLGPATGPIRARPAAAAESRELIAALRLAVEAELTDRQRRVFTAIVLAGVPLDAVAAELRSSRNAVYKMMFDAA
jgi:hypothetical protein